MSDEAIALSSPVVQDCPPPKAAASAGARSVVGHAKLISALTLVSRILGMAREAASAHYFGAGLVSSAFTVAFTIPNMFRKLFGEGALSAAFIPLYAQALKAESAGTQDRAAPSANEFAAASVNLLVAILVGLTIVGELILWAMIRVDPAMRADRLLTLKLAAIMLPYVLLICGTAFLSAVLQVHRRFGAPAATPIILNLVHIVVIILGARLLGIHSHGAETAALVAKQTTLAYWLGFFVLVAGVLQFLTLWRPLRQVGFRFMWVRHFWTAPVKRMLTLSIPVALGAGVLQLSVLLDKGLSLLLQQGTTATHFTLLGHVFRSPMELGAPARLNWAQFLYQFPLGVFAIALATAIFPSLSANALDADRGQFKSSLRHGIEMTLFEGLPASIGLILVAQPAIALLFQHGHVTPHDSVLIGRSVMLYSIAIWAFSLQQILNRAYYALHDTMTPLVLGIGNLVVNTLIELPLLWVKDLSEAGMAVGTLVAFSLQALLMLWMLNRRLGGMDLKKIAPSIARMIVASLLMWVACLAVQHASFWPKGGRSVIWAIQLTILMSVGGGVYFIACHLMGLRPMQHLQRRPAR
jgi:putative peptidoglycan lipid II flippase